MLEEKLDTLSQMMAQHMARPFPPGFRGLNIEDEDMVMLDADAYGWATRVLKGPLSAQYRSGLAQLTLACERVLPAIDDQYAAQYYEHVHDMVVLAAEIESLREK
ncbi:hypothetical protein B0I32_1182 [Nonomuraea fuscirosea]|uniref:Uncharacterized protein n=1 Tax=Nonomuraea fuscirosea TaxID=1291556 RepID=A0A2T0MPD0_9ACTN|nr:hypothetical protein [Nonomuraea fuscirosea]PRX59863.1 hypothetical protein B0I32_1182 [Nonomuraea fuscirosea]